MAAGKDGDDMVMLQWSLVALIGGGAVAGMCVDGKEGAAMA